MIWPVLGLWLSADGASWGLFEPFSERISWRYRAGKELRETDHQDALVVYAPFHFVGPFSMCSKPFLAQKMAVFGPSLQFLKLRSTTCESGSRPTVFCFSLKRCGIVLPAHRYHAPGFRLKPRHNHGVLIFAPFAHVAACLLACRLLACLLLAYWLAAAKPGGSTIDTKQGNKTKTGCNSSVTPTLTLPLNSSTHSSTTAASTYYSQQPTQLPQSRLNIGTELVGEGTSAMTG